MAVDLRQNVLVCTVVSPDRSSAVYPAVKTNPFADVALLRRLFDLNGGELDMLARSPSFAQQSRMQILEREYSEAGACRPSDGR